MRNCPFTASCLVAVFLPGRAAMTGFIVRDPKEQIVPVFEHDLCAVGSLLPLTEVIERSDLVVLCAPHADYRSIDLKGKAVIAIRNFWSAGSVRSARV
jgi:hypothetical protein